jgi:DegV family protein with EDD domain
MWKVAIVTDTISCIPPNLAKDLDIRVIPVSLVIDRKVYKDTILSNDEFWNLFYKAREPITTNAVTPGDFEKLLSEIGQKTNSIVCILVSKALSATHQAAIMAREALKKEKPGLSIEIIDSVSAAGSEGFIVLEAAKAAKAGKSLVEVLQVIKDTIPRANFFCAMDTLKYLIRSGRAPKIAFIGDIMKVKPIISINKENGLVENVGRARGKPKAMLKMVEMVKEAIDPNKPVNIIIHYTDSITDGEELKKIATSQLKCAEVYMTPYTPVMASQCGPVVAISYYQT